MQAIGILILCGSLLLALPVMGEEIYRSVDAQGNVTFSDQPPAGNRPSEKIELAPPPSAEQVRATEARKQAIDQAAQRAQRERQQQEDEKAQKIAQARKALDEAQAKLAKTKVLQDEDRQNLAGGKRRIRPEYFDRIKAAEAEVEKARKHLQQVRGY